MPDEKNKKRKSILGTPLLQDVLRDWFSKSPSLDAKTISQLEPALGQHFDVSADEGKFFKFLIDRYGFAGAIALRGEYTFRDITQSPAWKEWVRLGKPSSVKDIPSGQTTLFDSPAPPVTPLWEKTPEELSEIMYDTTKEPYAPPPGKKWQVSQYNEQGIPTRPMWILVDESTGVVEPAPTFGGRSEMEWTLGVPQFEWQKQQAELKNQREWGMGQTQLANDMFTAQRERNAAIGMSNALRMQQQFTMQQGQGYDARRQQALYDEFERVRADALNAFSRNRRDWVSAYVTSATPNPFQPQERSWSQEASAIKNELALAKEDLKLAREIEKSAASDPNRSLSGEEKQWIDFAKAGVQSLERNYAELQIAMRTGREAGPRGVIPEGSISDKYKSAAEEARWASPTPIEGGNFSVGAPEAPRQVTPTTPEIPSWLATASGLSGRVHTTRTGITRPSGQSWNRLAPTQQQMYAGLVDFAGNVPFEDVMNTMQVSTPKALSLGRTWSPARQSV